MSGPKWRRYLRFWRGNLDADVDDEFRFHLETEIEEFIARGMTPDAARAEALRRFGDIDAYRHYCHSADQRRTGRVQRKEALTVLAQDLRYALRSLRRQPAFTSIAIITLALAIGANTAIFSVVNGVLLKPLPYQEPNRLVMLWETTKSDDRILVSYKNYLDWRERQRGFTDVALYNRFATFNMTGLGDAERVRGALVTGNYFQLLGVQPAVGRLIGPNDDTPASPRVAVLSSGFFQSRFGGDPAKLGRTLVLDGEPYTIVGVLPPAVRISDRDVILPVGLFANQPTYARENHPGLIGLARLKPGMSLEQARADLQRVSTELREQYPQENAGIGSDGAPLIDMTVGRIKPALRILTIAVGFVLLIACANVANLLLSRAASRQREFALRTALGAERGRIVRQVLTESIVLALIGGTLGVGLAVAGVSLLRTLDPGSVPRLQDIGVDQTVLLFALAISGLTGLLFGLVPALQSARGQLVSTLKEGGHRGASAGASRQRTRAILTVVELALAVVLLAGAGLLVRSFEKLTAVDPGFEPAHILTGVVRLSEKKFATPEQQRAALDQLLEKVRAIPGVESATIGSDLPIATSWQSGVSFQSLPEPDPSKLPLLNVAVVDPTYFETLKIPLVSGRQLSASDGPGQPLVVLISEGIANRFFRNANPVGQRMKIGLASDTISWRTIVGVVQNTRTDGLMENPRGTFYMPRAQDEMRGGWLIVRSMLPTEQLTASIRRTLAELDKDMPLSRVRTMDAALAELVQQPRFSMLLLVLFASVALLLASVGIYGVISYNVTQRTSEIGIRIALGAKRRAVVGLVVRQAMTMAGAGVAIGMLLALWAGKSLSTMLYGVGPRDPLVLGEVSVFLLVVALAAAMAPAVRAARIDPIIAMRAD